MKDLLAAVDIGTTRLKVGLFDAEGRCVVSAARPCPPDYAADGTITLRAGRWWEAFADGFGECLAAVEASAVRAIGVSSQAQTYALLDGEGGAVAPAVSWLDLRGDAEGMARDLEDEEDYYGHAGWHIDPMLASCKLRRLSGGPGAWDGVEHVVFPDGWLMFRLTGRAGVSRNLASMSGLYSMKLGRWWPRAVAAARVPERALPTICGMGEPVGALLPEMARELGIPVVPVVAGANDQTAAALGCGLTLPGDTMLGMGTALVTYQVIRSSAPAAESRPLRGPYPCGLHWQMDVCNMAGAALEWARDLFGLGWEQFYDEALSAEPGSGGLRLSPHWDDGGALLGLRPGTSRRHLLRAVLEGIACAVREQFDLMRVSRPVRAVGGACANDGWMQMLADFTGRSIERLELAQGGLWGTAIMAAHGVGIFDDMLAAARARRSTGRRFDPRPGDAKIYRRVYDDYLESRNVRS